jgi:hypothetical protein
LLGGGGEGGRTDKIRGAQLFTSRGGGGGRTHIRYKYLYLQIFDASRDQGGGGGKEEILFNENKSLYGTIQR